jgi:myo-inositol-1(or 4)-monophosphatase
LFPPALEQRRNAAESAIREAGKLALMHFTRRDRLRIDQKAKQDVVSQADREAEALIIDALAKAFPEDGFLGEEGASRNLDAPAIWVIDPIDGTRNFVTGVPFWCISIGLVVDGSAVLGLIYDPPHNELFIAERGKGAYANGSPMRVTGETDVKKARICVGFSYRRPVAEHIRAIDALLSEGCEYCRLASGALGLAYTAAGRFDGYWERHLNSWDAAAGLVLVSEAGGFINDFLADDGLQHGNEMLATTPAIAEPVAKLVGFAGL